MTVDYGLIMLRSAAESAYAQAEHRGDTAEMARQAVLARQYNEMLRWPKINKPRLRACYP